ncbi:hypothetical protein DICPUDRAFT_158683 [Dictyostelium purpureum]|uniref:Uncharacterized protein n=1 Tax=Dictyostelium purpureum TaxID=5786 RepID=F1A275_DICPU|nr:uncharacterized protein DICPUDRAFT_158683 [Dictyostelium purpureum]EGC29706.1 hypothetical protein DICPUDRAFT_158683 [Dictyostelium purpureum]|eukprot:XP_003293771.1 hypothetical protein DICPUDRAFT_158683 [Dictyostelium purpureum]
MMMMTMMRNNRSLLGLSKRIINSNHTKQITTRQFSSKNKDNNGGLSSNIINMINDIKNERKEEAESKSSIAEAHKFRMVERPDLLSISSFFRYPEGGVDEYANLSKGTAFLVRPPSSILSKPNNSLYCISCAHITHPFHFPNLYKEEQYSWIYSLGEKNIKVQLEYRDQKTGKLLHTIPLKPPFHLHPMLDLVLFKVNEEDFKKTNVPYETTIMDLEHYEFPKEGHEGKLYGYQLESENDNIMRPIESSYTLNFVESPERYYVKTKNVSPMGICGGPVINIENEVIGMIEGLTKIHQAIIDKQTDQNKKNQLTKLNNNTVFIPSQELNRFITKVDLSYNDKGDVTPNDLRNLLSNF